MRQHRKLSLASGTRHQSCASHSRAWVLNRAHFTRKVVYRSWQYPASVAVVVRCWPVLDRGPALPVLAVGKLAGTPQPEWVEAIASLRPSLAGARQAEWERCCAFVRKRLIERPKNYCPLGPLSAASKTCITRIVLSGNRPFS